MEIIKVELKDVKAKLAANEYHKEKAQCTESEVSHWNNSLQY